MELLGKLFGSRDIVKILRLFILNPHEPYEISDVVERTKVERDMVRREVRMLLGIGFVKRRSFYKDIEQKRGERATMKKKRVSGYILDEEFAHLAALRHLVAGKTMMSERDLLQKLHKVGRLKLVVLTGVFLGSNDGRLDLLLVGDRFRHGVLEKVIRSIEVDLGKEIRFAAFSTDDFKYRLSMRDRLVRDTFDFAHNTVVDRLGIDQKEPAR